MTAKRLNQYRKNKGISYSHIQRKLAKIGINRTPENVSQILNGKRKPAELPIILKAIKNILYN